MCAFVKFNTNEVCSVTLAKCQLSVQGRLPYFKLNLDQLYAVYECWRNIVTAVPVLLAAV